MRVRPSIAIFAAALLLAPAAGARGQQKQTFQNLDEALQATGVLSGRSGPRSVNWIENGNRFSYIGRDDRGREVIRAVDPASGRDTVLFSAEGLTFPGETRAFNYQSFQWARDSRHLLFQTNFRQLFRRSGVSDYYIYTLADRSLQLAARDARTAELSPDGKLIGFERGGDMYTEDLATHHEARLTSDATEHVYNGHFDWVYEEEFGLAQAWNWSPDSRHIAFWQVDERSEPVIQLTDFEGRHPEWDSLRIPQPGDSNPRVRIGVLHVGSGGRTWLDTGEQGDFYIPRIYWTSRPDTLAVITLNRPQNEMKLFFFDVNTGGRRLVMTERSSTWIDVYDFYAGIQDMMSFPEGTHEFFWISDRDGYQHVYRYDYSGRLLNQVTRGQWSVTRIEGIDPATQTLFYSSTQASPLQRQLYAIRFDGTGERRITRTPGTHHVDMGPNTRYYLDRWSSTTQPRQVELWTTAGAAPAGGRMLRKLEDNAATTEWLATHAYSPALLSGFTTSDGAHVDYEVIRPVPFDSTRKYPVVFAIYGGPGSQGVYDEFNASGWLQWLAQEGYIVVDVNNRGTNNYGSAFEKTVYKHLGKWEAHDFAETARHLATRPYVDGRRVAIVGTSYGGYATLYTMEMYPDVFTVGVANSAVTDWRLYDTIYTERYMGLLPENVAGYDQSSAVGNVSKLDGKLLLIHSMMDDNVHPANTMQFLTAATNANKDVELRIYPPGHHGAAYNYESYRLITGVTDQHLRRYLRPGTAPGAAATTGAARERD